MRNTKYFFLFLFALTPSFAAQTGQAGNAYQYYLKGLLLESQGNFAGARTEIDRAIEIAPDSAFLYRTSAELSLKLGQVNKAVEEIERAIELDPKDVRALIIAGQTHWALGETDKAEACLKRALDLNPDESEALVSLAGALTPKNPKQAIKLYTDFLTRHPNESEIQERLAQLYQMTGESDKAKATWEDVLQESPNSVRAHLALAQIAEVHSDTATAISHYEGVLQQDPTNLPLLLRIGELRYRNNDMAKASEAFTQAKSVAPDSAGANFWLALLAEQRSDWSEAITCLKQIPNGEHDAGIQLRLSYYYSQSGQYKEAIKVLKELSLADPANTDFLNYLAVAYEQDKQTANAEKTILRIIEIDPNDAEAHFHLATLYDRTHRFPLAEKELKTAIGLKPDFHMALNYLGYSYAEKNIHLDEAEQLINNAIALDPNNPAYLDSMGWVYFRQGKMSKAKDFLMEATSRVRDPLIFEHLGDVYLANGETVDAILAWDESLRSDSEASSPRKKINKAIKGISKQDKWDVFVKRAVSTFGDLATVDGLVDITVCQGKPCFKSKAQFNYSKGDVLNVEIPGPLSGPVLVVNKKYGIPATYGALHPQFQTVETFVVQAFNRIEELLSADVFDEADLNVLRSKVAEEKRKLVANADTIGFSFNANSGEISSLDWTSQSQSDSLVVGPYQVTNSVAFPKYMEWHDKKSGFTLRFDFTKPVISTMASEKPKKKHL